MRMRKGMAVIAAIVMAAVLSAGSSLAATSVGMVDGAAAVTVNATTVGFAGHEWWVIGDESSGVYKQAGSVTLLAKNADFGDTPFDEFLTNAYKESTLQKRMVEIADGLAAKERGKINDRRLSAPDDIVGDEVEDQKLWPLSRDEYLSIGSDNVRSYGEDNWLRSCSPYSNNLAYVAPVAGGSDIYLSTVGSMMAARPALNLNVTSVIFTSDAGQTGKASATPDGGLVSATAPDTTGTNNKIKYTFRDDSLKLGNVYVSKIEGNKVTVAYDGATAGKTLSIIVKNNSGVVTHYGKLAENISAQGETNLDITNIDVSKNSLELFVEEIGKDKSGNDENHSDFASIPKAFDMTVKKLVTVNGGTGGGPYPKDAEVTITANAAQGKRFVRWDISPGVTLTQGSSLTDESIKFIMPDTAVTATAVYEDVYTVSVTGGTGGGEYAEGEEVTLTADATAQGKRFVRWDISPTVTPTEGSLTDETIKFTMPDAAVTATAVYEDVYTVSVTGGIGGGQYAEGEEVTLTADAAAEGKRFVRWDISPTVTPTEGSLTDESIKFTMPDAAVTATAVYEDVYTVSVTGGIGGGQYAEGEEVTLTADAAAQGKRFVRWDIAPAVTPTQGTSLTDESIKFTMPDTAVTATTVYEDVYTVTVTGGTGGGEYAEGEEVTLTADAAAEGKYFWGWSITPQVTLAEGTLSSGIIKLKMPGENVTATAVYEDIPPVIYPIKDGGSSTWQQGDEGGLVITSEGEHRKFTGVSIDGAVLDSENYTAVSGSTIVTLKASYLSTLSVGEHVLRIHFTDGYTETRFNVQEVQTDKPTPPTTDPGEPTPPVEPGEPTSPVNPPVQPGEPNPPVEQGGTTATTSTETTVATVEGTSPKTGDSNLLWLIASLMLGAGAVMLIAAGKKQKA